jgi:chromate transporter
VAALVGILAAPAAIAVVLAALFLRYVHVPAVAHAMGAVASAAAGLVVGTAVKMAVPIVRKDWVLAVPVGGLTVVLAGIVRWPLPPVLLVTLTMGIGLAWARRFR